MQVSSLTLAAVLAGALLVSTPPSAADVSGLTPYTATYSFERGAVKAEVEEKLSLDGAGYTYASNAKAKGLASALQGRPATQHSRFTLENGVLQPSSLNVDDGTKKGEKSTSIAYDWDDKVANVSTKEGDFELPLAPGTLDVLTAGLQLQIDLQRGAGDPTYKVIDGKIVRDYVFTKEGEEKVEVAAGTFDAHKYRLERSNRSSIIYTWHVPGLEYLPVRTEEHKDGKRRYTVDLLSVEGLGD